MSKIVNKPLKDVIKPLKDVIIKTVKEGIVIEPKNGKYKYCVIWLHGLKSSAEKSLEIFGNALKTPFDHSTTKLVMMNAPERKFTFEKVAFKNVAFEKVTFLKFAFEKVTLKTHVWKSRLSKVPFEKSPLKGPL